MLLTCRDIYLFLIIRNLSKFSSKYFLETPKQLILHILHDTETELIDLFVCLILYWQCLKFFKYNFKIREICTSWYLAHQVLDSESYVCIYKVCLSVVCLTVSIVCRAVHAVLGLEGHQSYCVRVSITQGLHNGCILDLSFWIVTSRPTHQV